MEAVVLGLYTVLNFRSPLKLLISTISASKPILLVDCWLLQLLACVPKSGAMALRAPNPNLKRVAITLSASSNGLPSRIALFREIAFSASFTANSLPM